MCLWPAVRGLHGSILQPRSRSLIARTWGAGREARKPRREGETEREGGRDRNHRAWFNLHNYKYNCKCLSWLEAMRGHNTAFCFFCVVFFYIYILRAVVSYDPTSTCRMTERRHSSKIFLFGIIINGALFWRRGGGGSTSESARAVEASYSIILEQTVCLNFNAGQIEPAKEAPNSDGLKIDFRLLEIWYGRT